MGRGQNINITWGLEEVVPPLVDGFEGFKTSKGEANADAPEIGELAFRVEPAAETVAATS